MVQTATVEPPIPLPQPKARKWPPLLGLLAVMTFVTLGGYLFSGTPANPVFSEDVEVGTAVPVAQGVTIQPAEGWVVTDEVGDPPGIVLEGGNGLLLTGVPGGTGSPEELVDFYVSGYLEPQASQLSTGTTEPVTMPAGAGAIISYVGVFEGVDVPIEGEVIAIIGPSGTGVVLDGWSQQGTYAAVRDQVRAMAESVVIP
jgi:hypothetical protein